MHKRCHDPEHSLRSWFINSLTIFPKDFRAFLIFATAPRLHGFTRLHGSTALSLNGSTAQRLQLFKMSSSRENNDANGEENIGGDSIDANAAVPSNVDNAPSNDAGAELTPAQRVIQAIRNRSSSVRSAQALAFTLTPDFIASAAANAIAANAAIANIANATVSANNTATAALDAAEVAATGALHDAARFLTWLHLLTLMGRLTPDGIATAHIRIFGVPHPTFSRPGSADSGIVPDVNAPDVNAGDVDDANAVSDNDDQDDNNVSSDDTISDSEFN